MVRESSLSETSPPCSQKARTVLLLLFLQHLQGEGMSRGIPMDQVDKKASQAWVQMAGPETDVCAFCDSTPCPYGSHCYSLTGYSSPECPVENDICPQWLMRRAWGKW